MSLSNSNLSTSSPLSTTARPTSVIPPAASSSRPLATSSIPTPQPPMSAELEQTLAKLSIHRSMLGYLLIARGHHPSIIRRSGAVFEGEQGKKYAAVVARIVESVQNGLEEISSGDGLSGTEDADEVRFMRIRTKKHELMISPDSRYLLAVLHDPGS